VSFIHESPETIGFAVTPSRCKKVNAVIPPVSAPRKISDRHQLDCSNTEVQQIGQPAKDSVEGAVWTKRANVQLIKDEIPVLNASPVFVGPFE
jgi:hypothetical protein